MGTLKEELAAEREKTAMLLAEINGLRAQAAQKQAQEELELFRVGTLGIKMIDCLNCFAPQPFNFDGINRAFHKYFCDCSMNGYFTPAPLNFSVGNRHGWVSFGLLDLPDSYEYKMTRRLGVLVEKPCGHIKVQADQWYTAPRLLLTFPKDAYSGVRLYRQKLEEFGIIAANKLVNYRLQQLELKVQAHNNLIDRTYRLEGQMTEVQHDIKDLKGYHKPQ